MWKSVFLGGLLACGALAIGGCGSDGGGGGAGSGAGGNGSKPPPNMVEDTTPINTDCPLLIKPFDGAYGPKGACCYRTSNKARIDATAKLAVLEYRLQYFMPTNHPKTISGEVVKGATIARYDKEEQHLLFRFQLPIENGEFVAGDGMAQIGSGRYNCDGTYSFYNDSAAPNFGNLTDPARWSTAPVQLKVDPTKSTWEEQVRVVWKTNVNRDVAYLPYTLTSGAKGLEWEAASQGFGITRMPPVKDSVDCVGKRASSTEWMPNGETVSYQRLDLNDGSAIMVLGNISLAHLQAFGPAGAKDDPLYDPVKAARCQPGSAGCVWQKLPDSLCPVTDDEKKSWGCHIADPDNEDQVTTKCSMTAPTGVLDPDEGATSEGQCCDPLATGKAGLPACNAYRLLSDIVAAAVDITDETADALQPNCEM